jgi:hypothetical protein
LGILNGTGNLSRLDYFRECEREKRKKKRRRKRNKKRKRKTGEGEGGRGLYDHADSVISLISRKARAGWCVMYRCVLEKEKVLPLDRAKLSAILFNLEKECASVLSCVPTTVSGGCGRG